MRRFNHKGHGEHGERSRMTKRKPVLKKNYSPLFNRNFSVLSVVIFY